MSYSKHFSGHTRPCQDCGQRLPTHKEKKNRYTQLPELMDPVHEGMPHWMVCPKKHTPEQIATTTKNFYVNRVQWKKDNGYNVTLRDYSMAGMEIPPDMDEEEQEQPIQQQEFDSSISTGAGAATGAAKVAEETKKPSDKFEDYLLKKFDENWKIIHDYNARVEAILSKIVKTQNEQNAMLRSIMRHVGIVDT